MSQPADGWSRFTGFFKNLGVNVEQVKIPEVIPADGCYLGRQESLMQLAKLVEPQIAD